MSPSKLKKKNLRRLSYPSATRTVAEVLLASSVDEEALGQLKNTEGLTFEGWARKFRASRLEWEAKVRAGYPGPELAKAEASRWAGWLGTAREQAAVSKAFYKRAFVVIKAVLRARGISGEEAAEGAEARAWEFREEAERWEALAGTLREWLWQVRGVVKSEFKDRTTI